MKLFLVRCEASDPQDLAGNQLHSIYVSIWGLNREDVEQRLSEHRQLQGRAYRVESTLQILSEMHKMIPDLPSEPFVP